MSTQPMENFTTIRQILRAIDAAAASDHPKAKEWIARDVQQIEKILDETPGARAVGPIQFVIDGEIVTLAPGTYRRDP